MKTLETVGLMLGDLPDVAAEWEGLSEGERAGWSLDWSNEMSKLESLAQDDSSHMLTAAQQASYRSILQSLREATPTLERLGLYRPSIPPEA
jgi:hypothetical protein